MSTLMVTGHRPNKLIGGYDYKSEMNMILRNELYRIISESDCNHFISGGALGVDQLFALEVIRLKKDNPEMGIILEIAVPCRNHSSKWFPKSIEIYDYILKHADKVTLVTDAEYAPRLMQIRNEYMVNNADFVLAVWDGSAGGTKNCIDYAKSKGKLIEYLNPNTMEIGR
jgi:uncharacterized phage-like protein YoqJ